MRRHTYENQMRHLQTAKGSSRKRKRTELLYGLLRCHHERLSTQIIPAFAVDRIIFPLLNILAIKKGKEMTMNPSFRLFILVHYFTSLFPNTYVSGAAAVTKGLFSPMKYSCNSCIALVQAV
jgi:hypothetical protein